MVYYSCYASPSGRISPRFFGTSAGALEPLALACAPQVDPGEDHGELRRLEFDAVAFGGAGHREGSALESLVPDDQPVTIKEEDGGDSRVDEPGRRSRRGVGQCTTARSGAPAHSAGAHSPHRASGRPAPPPRPAR